ERRRALQHGRGGRVAVAVVVAVGPPLAAGLVDDSVAVVVDSVARLRRGRADVRRRVVAVVAAEEAAAALIVAARERRMPVAVGVGAERERIAVLVVTDAVARLGVARV